MFISLTFMTSILSSVNITMLNFQWPCSSQIVLIGIFRCTSSCIFWLSTGTLIFGSGRSMMRSGWSTFQKQEIIAVLFSLGMIMRTGGLEGRWVIPLHHYHLSPHILQWKLMFIWACIQLCLRGVFRLWREDLWHPQPADEGKVWLTSVPNLLLQLSTMIWSSKYPPSTDGLLSSMDPSSLRKLRDSRTVHCPSWTQLMRCVCEKFYAQLWILILGWLHSCYKFHSHWGSTSSPFVLMPRSFNLS